MSLASKWRKGTWVGIDNKSGMHVVVLNTDVAVRVRIIRRRPDAEKWDSDKILKITATPRILNPDRPGSNKVVHINEESVISNNKGDKN